jgi:ribosomal protein S25
MDGTEYGSGHIPSRGLPASREEMWRTGRNEAPLMIEYPNAGSGHAGNDTSRERQEREDATGITAETQRAALFLLEADQFRGMTAAEFEDRQGIGHGRASSALSHLHRAGHIRRLKEKRVKHEVYVLPQYVAEREESPYRPRQSRVGNPTLKKQAEEALLAAATARAGDSNDTEIEALWECADLLAQALSLTIPDIGEEL